MSSSGQKRRFHDHRDPQTRQAFKHKKARFVLATLAAPTTADSGDTISAPENSLLGLATELRLMIYSHIIDFKGNIRVATDDFEPFQSLDKTSIALLGTCKVIREEVSTLFYQGNTFTFISLQAVAHFKENIGTFIKDVKSIAVTSNLLRQRPFKEQLPAFFDTFPNFEHFTVPQTPRTLLITALPNSFTSQQLWIDTSLCRRKVEFYIASLQILKASRRLMAGKAFYFERNNELRFVPGDTKYAGSTTGTYTHTYRGDAICEVKIPEAVDHEDVDETGW